VNIIQLVNDVGRVISMLVMVFNMCNSSEFNRQQCMKDWDVWLWPEIQKGFDLKFGIETPYQQEQEILEGHEQTETIDD